MFQFETLGKGNKMNMSYCRMENTYKELEDVFQNWESCSDEEEKEYRNKILEICKKIIEKGGRND